MSPVKIIEREIFDEAAFFLVDFHGTAESRNDFPASEPLAVGCAACASRDALRDGVFQVGDVFKSFLLLLSPFPSSREYRDTRENSVFAHGTVIYGFYSLMQDTGICTRLRTFLSLSLPSFLLVLKYFRKFFNA